MKKLGIFILFLLFITRQQQQQKVLVVGSNVGFVKRSGLHFVLDGRPFYANGFNAYWLMYFGSDPSLRNKVSSAFREASSYGLNVARTWAFSDGGYSPLQFSPGSYNEEMFGGLDFVISEAREYGIRLILSLVNNYDDFGGKRQYVQWARNEGHSLSSDDEFFSNNIVKRYYKNHVHTILTRVNRLTGVAYKDNPTILAWELMNEPRLANYSSRATLQEWIVEMAAFVKSIDNNHLLEVGLEGFYGQASQEREHFNPGFQVGADFIWNNNVLNIDFATVHSYPDQWLSTSNDESQNTFLANWLDCHIQDAQNILKKPVLFTEFGKSQKDPGYSIQQRNVLFSTIYDKIYYSARSGGAAAGGLFWQFFTKGMDSWRDGYEVVFSENPSTANLIAQQSLKMLYLQSSSKLRYDKEVEMDVQKSDRKIR